MVKMKVKCFILNFKMLHISDVMFGRMGGDGARWFQPCKLVSHWCPTATLGPTGSAPYALAFGLVCLG
jgi:hypothetical protein